MKKLIVLSMLILAPFISVSAQNVDSVQVQNLLSRYACKSCHFMKSMPVGPGWVEMAQRDYTLKQFVQLMAEPKPENWPDYPPMTPMPYVPEKDLEKIYQWMLTLKEE